MSSLKAKVKKNVVMVLSNQDNPLKVVRFLNQNYGAWVDVEIFKKVLERNKLSLFVQYNKIVKEVSDALFKEIQEMGTEVMGIIDKTEIPEFEEIKAKHISIIRNVELKKLLLEIF